MAEVEEAYVDYPCHSVRSRNLERQLCQVEAEAVFLVEAGRYQTLCNSDEVLSGFLFRMSLYNWTLGSI